MPAAAGPALWHLPSGTINKVTGGLQHCRRARCEVRIRRAKDAGLNAFPLQGFDPAVSIIALACDPLARSQGSAVARSPVRWWESKRMHPRLISVPAVIARHARRVVTAAPPAIPGPASWCPGSNTSGHHPPRSDRSGALCMIAAPGRRSAGPERARSSPGDMRRTVAPACHNRVIISGSGVADPNSPKS